MQTNIIAIPNTGLQGLIKEKPAQRGGCLTRLILLYKKHSILQGIVPEVLSLGKAKIKCKSEESMNKL